MSKQSREAINRLERDLLSCRERNVGDDEGPDRREGTVGLRMVSWPVNLLFYVLQWHMTIQVVAEKLGNWIQFFE